MPRDHATVAHLYRKWQRELQELTRMRTAERYQVDSTQRAQDAYNSYLERTKDA